MLAATVCGIIIAEAVYASEVVTPALISCTFVVVTLESVPVIGLKLVSVFVPQILIVASLKSSISSLVKVTLIFANLCVKVNAIASVVLLCVLLTQSKSLSK